LVADLRQESVYALELEIFETAGSFELNLKYRPGRYETVTVTRMLEHYLRLAEGVIGDPGQTLDAYPLLNPAATAVLARSAAVATDHRHEPVCLSADACLHEVFARQARATPDAVAVTCEEHSLTYRELEARSTTLAHYLRRHGVGVECLVGLSMAPSPEMIVALLGILKAGGAYVPLDPAYPPERLAFMIRDSGVRLILTQTDQATKLAAVDRSVEVVALDRDWPMITHAARAGARPASLHPAQAQQLAYVVYTSGSTGTPKGALVQHDHIMRLFSATDRYFHFNSADTWTLFHSLSFDFSVWEVWGALLYGGRLVVVPEAVRRSPRELYDLVIRERVSVLN
jgi:non-ribosomal peptide synthetase component F